MAQPLGPKELARYIDHTVLKPEASLQDIEKLCAEAREHGFYSVCVNGSRVAQAYHLVEDSGVKVASILAA